MSGFQRKTAVKRAREVGEALVEVEGNVNKAMRLINAGADVNYVDRWMDVFMCVGVVCLEMVMYKMYKEDASASLRV